MSHCLSYFPCGIAIGVPAVIGCCLYSPNFARLYTLATQKPFYDWHGVQGCGTTPCIISKDNSLLVPGSFVTTYFKPSLPTKTTQLHTENVAS